MARPKIPIDKIQFEKLCAIQCTLDEIAYYFDCSEDTVERWVKRTYKKTFTEIFNIKKSGGRIALRKAQFRLAKKNASMAIFLGKNLLGQTDDPMPDDPEAFQKAREILGGIDSAID